MLLSFLLFFSLYKLFQSHKTKFCVNCKYFIQADFSPKNEFGLCLKYPRIEENLSNYIVTGEDKKENVIYHYCRTARTTKSMCDFDGKDYKRKYIKKVKSEEENE
jgi:hypothetical protein